MRCVRASSHNDQSPGLCQPSWEQRLHAPGSVSPTRRTGLVSEIICVNPVRARTEVEPGQHGVAFLQRFLCLWAPSAYAVPYPFYRYQPYPAANSLTKKVDISPRQRCAAQDEAELASQLLNLALPKQLNFSVCLVGLGRKQNTINSPLPPPAPYLHRTGFQPLGEPPPQDRPVRTALAPRRPLSRLVRSADGPGLTADHPAAEGPVAAEQCGAQQQRDHAAHRGAAAAAAAAAGVAWSEGASARRAAGALTPLSPCLPAGPYSGRPNPTARPPARIASG